jgi:hypothetical protein
VDVWVSGPNDDGGASVGAESERTRCGSAIWEISCDRYRMINGWLMVCFLGKLLLRCRKRRDLKDVGNPIPVRVSELRTSRYSFLDQPRKRKHVLDQLRGTITSPQPTRSRNFTIAGFVEILYAVTRIGS